MKRVVKWIGRITIVLAIFAMVGLGYKKIYDMVPARIRLKAGVEQILDLKVPVNGIITKNNVEKTVTVSGKQKSNIAEGELYIDLSKVVTLKADDVDNYQMDLKLFGWIPFKQVDIEVIKDMMLTPVGEPIGIYVKTEGVLVVDVGEFEDEMGKKQSPAKYLLRAGDYIVAVDGIEISEKTRFVSAVEESEGAKMELTIQRDSEEFEVSIQPCKNVEGDYKVGIWVRDNAQGVGTLTFIDDLGNFGALGHGISDVDTGTLLSLKSGSLYKTEIVAIRKGKNGEPGEMTGMIDYSGRNILGEITANTSKGIYGKCSLNYLSELQETMGKEALPIGLKQDIREGAAQILCNVDGEARYYDILIKEVYLEHSNVNRGMLIKVTDPELLALTGGIIQGMFTSYNGSNNRKASKIKGFLMF